jgi:phage tail sheath gpL-like
MAINFNLADPNAVASQVLVESQRVRRAVSAGVIPHKILVLGIPNADKTPEFLVPQAIDSVGQARNLYGRGSQIAVTIEKVFATKGGVPVTVIPIEGDPLGVAGVNKITVAGTVTKTGLLNFRLGGKTVRVVALVGDTATVLAGKIRDAFLAPDLTATPVLTGAEIDLTVKWAGTSGNDLALSLNRSYQEQLDAPVGVTVTIATPKFTGGLLDPDIMPALLATGDVWYTVIVNPFASSDAREALRLRWIELNDPKKNKIFTSCEGYNGDKAGFVSIAQGLNGIGVSLYPVPLSESLPSEIAGAVAGTIARSAQLDPERPFNGIELVGIDGAREIWDVDDRNDVVLAGGSTTRTDEFGTVRLEDAVTTYKQDPDGTPSGAWRFVETVTNSQVKRYGLFLVFSRPPYDRAVIVDDNSTTTKAHAVRPKTVKATLTSLAREWVANAWSKNLEEILASIDAVIDPNNPNRLNAVIGDVFTAGGKVWAVKHEWDFVPPEIN